MMRSALAINWPPFHPWKRLRPLDFDNTAWYISLTGTCSKWTDETYILIGDADVRTSFRSWVLHSLLKHVDCYGIGWAFYKTGEKGLLEAEFCFEVCRFPGASQVTHRFRNDVFRSAVLPCLFWLPTCPTLLIFTCVNRNHRARTSVLSIHVTTVRNSLARTLDIQCVCPLMFSANRRVYFSTHS